ncbi:hypothetical protein THAOC_08211, partial [Thalassiosira oceanica]
MAAMDSSADGYQAPSDPRLSGGRHLIFSEDDMASDGSDWADPGSTSSSEEDSISSDNYDMEIDTPRAILKEKVKVVYIPPLRSDPSNMSVKELESLIERHRKTKSVREFLCGIDADSDLYEG